MDEEIKRFVYASILIIGVVLISFLIKTSLTPSNLIQNSMRYTISELIQEKPVGKNIKVYGSISKILGDYKSKKGNIYQRFVISDNKNEILVFCSTYYGRKDFKIGKKVLVEGQFQKYKEQYEIYSYCSNIQELS